MRISSTLILLLSLSLTTKAQTPCENGMADIYPCDGYDLLYHYPLEDIGGGDNGNDCWGWVDEESGREFVIYGRSNGTSFVDITDPLNPQHVAILPTESSSSLWRDIKVIGNYAYIVSEAPQHGLQIVNMEEILQLNGFPYIINPTHYYQGFGNSHNIVANPETNYVYAVGTNTFYGGLHIIDVSDPSSPLLAGSYSEFYTHDAQAVIYNGPDEDYQGQEIVFCFNGDQGVVIVNAEDKSDVQLIYHLTYDESAYTHQGWLSEDHSVVYFNDELDEQYGGYNTRTYMMDASDLDNPFIIGFYEAETISSDHNLYTHGGLLYASNYTSGLRVSTILDDGTIEPQGFFDTYPLNDTTTFDGTWSNYPFFPSGTIAVSNFDGLFLLRSSDWTNDNEDNLEVTTPSFSISPNPASTTLRINGLYVNCGVRVHDASGKLVVDYNRIPSLNGLNIDIQGLVEGIYLVNLYDPINESVIAAEKLVVNR